MILVAAAAAPMALAIEDLAKCMASESAASVKLVGAGGAPCDTDTAKCPDGAQAAIDTAFGDCGGQTFEILGIELDWDATQTLTAQATACKCSAAAAAAPVFALVAAAMPFFN